MGLEEKNKKIKFKILLPREEFTKILDGLFATIDGWKTCEYVLTIKTRRKLQPYFEKYNMEVNE